VLNMAKLLVTAGKLRPCDSQNSRGFQIVAGLCVFSRRNHTKATAVSGVGG